jgi:hypothetical protein
LADSKYYRCADAARNFDAERSTALCKKTQVKKKLYVNETTHWSRNNLFGLIEKSNKQVNGFQFLKPKNILWADGAFPNGSCGGSEKFFVFRLGDEADKGIKAPVFTYQVTSLFFFSALYRQTFKTIFHECFARTK